MFFILADGKPFAKIELSNNNKKTDPSNLNRDNATDEKRHKVSPQSSSQIQHNF